MLLTNKIHQQIYVKQTKLQYLVEKSNDIPVLYYDTGSIFDIESNEDEELIKEKSQIFLLWCLDNVEGDWSWTIEHMNVFETHTFDGKLIDRRRVILILTESKQSAILLKLSNIGIQILKDMNFANDRRMS
jgi:hypothetical protein